MALPGSLGTVILEFPSHTRGLSRRDFGFAESRIEEASNSLLRKAARSGFAKSRMTMNQRG